MTQEKHMSTISTTTTTMTASGTSNDVYISSPIQHNNILRSHQLIFTATYDERLCDNGEDNTHHDHDLPSLYEALNTLSTSRVPPNYIEQIIYPASNEALKTLSTSPVPLNCLEQMINPGSIFTFVTRQLSECLGEPFRHFLNLYSRRCPDS
jgi:hypothetical protein